MNGEFLILNCTDEKFLFVVVISAEAGIQSRGIGSQDKTMITLNFPKRCALPFLCQEIRQDEVCEEIDDFCAKESRRPGFLLPASARTGSAGMTRGEITS